MKFSLEGLLRWLYPRPENRPQLSGVCTSAPAIHYFANCANCQTLTAFGWTTGNLRVVPFWAPRRLGATLSQLAAEVSTAVAGRNFRIGLYRNVTNPDSFYPGALLADSGDISSATIGLKTYAINQQLEPEVLYWMALSTDNTVTLRSLSNIGLFDTLGIPAGTTGLTIPYAIYIQAAFVHGALPNPFPAGGAYVNNISVCPGLRYQFSA